MESLGTKTERKSNIGNRIPNSFQNILLRELQYIT